LSLSFVLLVFKGIHQHLKFFFSYSSPIIEFEIFSVANSFDGFPMGSTLVLRGPALLFEKLSLPEIVSNFH